MTSRSRYPSCRREVLVDTMKALLITRVRSLDHTDRPLEPADIPIPEPQDHELLVHVSACGVCHTELDEIEGRTPPPSFPVVPGHQVVGHVERCGKHVSLFRPGDRVGIAWIFFACGTCRHCKDGNENLCPQFRATGRDVNGGYAEFLTVPERFAYSIPEVFTDSEAAPLLCAGAIGYRSLRLANMKDGYPLGLTGFGASAHLVLKMTKHKYPRSEVYVFARSAKEREFARDLGAAWAGDTADEPPVQLHAIIDTTPAWKPIIEGLRHLAPGGRLVINAIRKEDSDMKELLGIDYPKHLWMEKEIKSVANVARKDVGEFLTLAAEMRIRPEVQEYPLVDANTVLLELKQRKIRGAKVLRIPT